MIKVFTLNTNGKIELTKEELQDMLDKSYWDGFFERGKSWTYESPKITWENPYVCTNTSSSLEINKTESNNSNNV